MKIKAREYHVFRQDLVPEDHVVDYEFMDMNEDIEVDMFQFAQRGGMYICSGKGLLAEIEILGYVQEGKIPAFMAGTVSIDSSVQEFKVEQSKTVSLCVCREDGNTAVWYENARECTRAVNCGDITFYLDGDNVMIGFMVRESK